MASILGIGNPVLEVSDVVDAELLSKYQLPSSNTAITADAAHLQLYAELSARPTTKFRASGAGQNSVRVAQWMLQAPGSTAFIGCVGADESANKLREVCMGDGVNALYVVDPTHPTSVDAVCITGRTRCCVTKAGAGDHLSSTHATESGGWAAVLHAKVVYCEGCIASMAPECVESAASQAAKQGNFFCMRLGAPDLLRIPVAKRCFVQAMPCVDYLFAKGIEAKTWAEVQGWDTQDLNVIASRLSLIPSATGRQRHVVIIQGAQKTLIAHGESLNTYPLMKLRKEEVVDASGADDAYIGGFLAGLSKGVDANGCHDAGAYAHSVISQQFGCVLPGPSEFDLGLPNGSILSVLNSNFRVVAYNGGAEGPKYSVEHVLTPTLHKFHCSKDGIGWTLDLESSEPVYITHFAIHGPAGCTEPLKAGRIWVSEAGPPLGSIAPTLAFETDSSTKEWSSGLITPTLAKFVRITFDSTHGEGANVDVAMVAIVGTVGCNPPPPERCQRKIPPLLAVTNLKRFKKRTNWLPLESNPKILDKYLHKLGFDKALSIHEVLGLEPWAFDMLPGPAHALVFLFPITEGTEVARKTEVATATSAALDGVVHMKQLVGNACGTIALLHIMVNLVKFGGATVETGSWLERFLGAYQVGMTSEDVGSMLEEDVAIAAAHREAEEESEVRNSEAMKNLHFIAFVNINGKVVELDGRRDGPVLRGEAGPDRFLAAAVQTIREQYIALAPGEARFSVMALCGSGTTNMDVDTPTGASFVSDAAVAQLVEMGFPHDAARAALEATGGSVENAMGILLG